MAKAKRIKRTHKFQLNINKGIESWLHERIPMLKEQKKFSQYVREGLSLMIYFAEWGITAQSVYDLFMELRSGQTNKLFEMFPHLQPNIGQVAPVSQPPAPDTSELAKEIATQLILRGGKDTLQMIQGGQQPDSNRTGQLTGKPLAAPQFALPNWDEEDDTPTVIINKSNDMSSAANFVTALRSMQ